MEDYKNEIQQTRKGCLGSSDGRILAQIASLGEVPKSAYKRMAVVKGLIPQEEIPRTAAIQAGDDLEMIVYEHLNAKDPRYESNPLWESKKYSKPNVKLISHPDIVFVNEETKTINIFEVKTTKYDFNTTRQTYSAQLFIHFIIGKEKALELGRDWNVRLFLAHYSTDGLDLTNGVEFDAQRLTVKRVQFTSAFFDVDKAMNIVNDFLEDFNEYYEGDEIDSMYLPEKVKQEFDTITNVLAEIKEREQKVNDFKEHLYDFMKAHDVKSIKNDAWSITRVDPTESRQFDSKAFLQDYATKHPRAYKKLVSGFEKVVKRKGSVQIRLKEKKDNNE